MKALSILLILAMQIQAAPKPRTFTGVISDSMCERGDHSKMQMGPTDGECVAACVEEHGAKYVLFTGREVYGLSDQNAPERFAGKRVTVKGRLDAKTKAIKVDSITAAR